MSHQPKLLDRDFARRWNHRAPRPDDGHPRPRVLVEAPDVAEAFAYWCLLTDEGCRVSWCPGPSGRPPRRCPLTVSGRCELVESADVVVSALPLHRAPSREVVVAIGRLHPGKPVVVQAPKQVLAQWRPLFEGRPWYAVPAPVTTQTLLGSVELALSRSPTKPGTEPTVATDGVEAPVTSDPVRTGPHDGR